MYASQKTPGQARTVSLVREKTAKPVASAMSGTMGKFKNALSLGSRPGAMGPQGLDNNRDAWANALSSMSGVNTPDPLSALAKVAGMGFAGYGQGKATREKEAGTTAFKSKLADALAGKPDNATLMGLMNDPYADSQSQSMAWDMWQRNNPTEDQMLSRQRAQLELDQADDPQYDMQQGADGQMYYVPKVPGQGSVSAVPGFTPRPGEGRGRRTATVNNKVIDLDTGEVIYDGGADPASAPKTDTYRTKDPETGEVIEITREWTPEGWQEVGRAPYKPGGGVILDMTGGNDKQVFDRIGQNFDTITSMRTGLRSMREAKKAILDGAITGPFAEQRLFMQQIGASLGVANPDRIVNTQTFRAAIAPQVSAMIKATVGSSQISNTDREFAMMAAGGQIDLNEGTILRLLDIMERANAVAIDEYQARLDKVYPPDSTDPGVQRSRALYEVPDEAPMQGDMMRLPPDPAQADAAYAQMPSGTWFMAPDGTVRRKP
jgi:hypothetical protein